MGEFLLSENLMLPELRLCDEFIGDCLASEKGGFKCELVKVEERDGKQAVNARELHQKLGSKQDFSTWVKSRIEKYGFVENQDFEVFHKIMENSNGGRSRIEYALSLDMAKELCMVENNEAGRRIRKYFIEAEKKFRESKSSLAIPDFTDPAIAARAWADQYEKNKRLTLENKLKQEALEQSTKEVAELQEEKRVNAPKVVFTDAVAGSKGNCLIGEVAKLITQNGYKMGQNQFFAWLRNNGYLGTKGERYNVPNQKYVGENGIFYIKRGVRQGNDGVLFTTSTPMVTPKGQIYFVNKFLNKGFEGELF